MSKVYGTAIKKLVGKKETFKLATKEAQMAGTALDMVLHSRAMAMADLGNDFNRRGMSLFERGVEDLSRNYGLVNGISMWNNAMKKFSATISATRILEEAAKFSAGKIAKKDLEYLTMLGIDRRLADEITDMFNKHGKSMDGVLIAQTDKWTSNDAVQAFRAALIKDVDITIITPGQDVPFWMQKGVGRLIGQFRSFGFASTQRSLILGLQQGDAAALSGIVTMVTLGMMQYAIAGSLAGFELSDNPLTVS